MRLYVTFIATLLVVTFCEMDEKRRNSAKCQIKCVKWFKYILCLKCITLLKPIGHVMHRQFNTQQMYALPTLFMCFVFI